MFLVKTIFKMNRRGSHSRSNYKQTANRLRDKLDSRNQSNNDEQSGSQQTSNQSNDRPPAGLRGRDIGMWYAQRSKNQRKADGKPIRQEKKLVRSIFFKNH